MGLLIGLNTLAFFNNLDILALRHSIYILSIIVLFIYDLKCENKNEVKSKKIIEYFCYLLILNYILNYNLYVFNGLIMSFFGILAYVFIVRIGSKEIDISKIILWICFANIVLMTFQVLGYDPIFTHHANMGADGKFSNIFVKPRLIGFMLQTKYIGLFLSLGLCFLPLSIAFLMLIPIISTKATICIISSIIILIWKSFNYGKKIGYFFTISLLSICFLFICFKFNTIYSLFIEKMRVRLPVWNEVLRESFNRLQGYGVGSWRHLGIQITEKYNTTWLDICNQYLQILWNFGILGLLILSKYFKYILKNINTKLGMCVVTILICSLFQSYLSCYWMLLTIITIFALKEIENDSYC